MSITQSDSIDHRRKLQDEFLELAFGVIAKSLTSVDEKVALSAAKWVTEMVIGKPSQAIQVEHSGKELAQQLVAALRQARDDQRLQARVESPHIIDGTVHVLGTVETPPTPPTEVVVVTSPVQEGVFSDFPG